MPVWVSTDAKLDNDAQGVQRRHINPKCPVYLREVPQAERCADGGRPNTNKVQARTVRCTHTDCWDAWEKDQVNKPKRARGKSAGSGSNAKSATTTPTVAVGGKAASLAQSAKQRRAKKPTTAAAA